MYVCGACGCDVEFVCGCAEMVIWSERSDRLGRVSRGTSVGLERRSVVQSVGQSVGR